MDEKQNFMREAILLSREGMERGEGGPFGCVIVKDGKIIGRGNNRVTVTNDPTAHAEMVAIRDACHTLQYFQLTNCDVYTSCEPCPMCMGALYWARPRAVYFAAGREDAAAAGFDDSMIYEEIQMDPGVRRLPMEQLASADAKAVFEQWIAKGDKTIY